MDVSRDSGHAPDPLSGGFAESLVRPVPFGDGAPDQVVDRPTDHIGGQLSVHGHLSQLFGRDSLYLLLWALQLGLAALATPAVTRLLGVGAFGTVVAANAIMQVIFVFVCLGLSTGIEKRFYESDGPNNARRLLTLSILIAVGFTVVAILSGALWSRPLGFDGFTRVLLYAVLWAGLTGVTATGLSLLRAQDRLLPFTTVSLLQSVVAEAASLLLVALWSPTAEHFLLGQLAGQVAAVACVLGWGRPLPIRRSDIALARSTLAFTLPLVPAALGGFAINAADRLIVQRYLGEREVGRYQIAYNIGSFPLLILSLLNGVWMPRFFSLGSFGDRAGLLAATRDALFRLLIPVTIGLSFGAPLMLRIWAPSSYKPQHLLFVLFMIIVTAIPSAASLSGMRVLLMTGRTKAIAAASLGAATANISLNVVLAPAYGLGGAAMATFASYTVLYLLMEIPARSAIPTPLPRMRLVGALVVSASVCWALSLLPGTTPFIVLRIAGSAVCVVWFAVLARSLSRTSALVSTGR